MILDVCYILRNRCACGLGHTPLAILLFNLPSEVVSVNTCLEITNGCAELWIDRGYKTKTNAPLIHTSIQLDRAKQRCLWHNL